MKLTSGCMFRSSPNSPPQTLSSDSSDEKSPRGSPPVDYATEWEWLLQTVLVLTNEKDSCVIKADRSAEQLSQITLDHKLNLRALDEAKTKLEQAKERLRNF